MRHWGQTVVFHMCVLCVWPSGLDKSLGAQHISTGVSLGPIKGHVRTPGPGFRLRCVQSVSITW